MYLVANSYYNNGKVKIEKPYFCVEKLEKNYSNEQGDFYFDYFETEEEANKFYRECLRA